MKLKKHFLLAIIAFFLFLCASIYITFPLIFHLGDYATGRGDELVIAWIQSWIIHSLFTNPLSLFNANIIYPYPNTLAYSDAFITGSIITALPALLIGQPISANNFFLIFSLIFDGFALYLLTFYLTKDFFASLLVGLVMIFSPATLSFAVHLQILFVGLVPLSLVFFLIFFDKNKTKYLILSLFCFLLQVYNSFLPGYFIGFSFIVILIFKYLDNKKDVTKLLTKERILLAFLTFLLTVPITLPYFQVSKEFHYVRDIRDTIHFAVQPEDFFYPGDNTRLKNFLLQLPTNHYSQNDEFKPGYLGFVFSLLTIGALIYVIKKRKRISTYEESFLTIAFIGLLLCLGPFLHLGRQTIHHPFPIPLPYLIFYYVIPGFQGLRNSARWEMLFILSIAVLIGLLLHDVVSRWRTKAQIIIYILLFIGIIVEFAPITFVSIPQKKDFPQVYSRMRVTPYNAAFIELPIYNWNTTPYVSQEMLREYYNTENFRKMVNGYSGFSPPPWQQMIASMHANFPNKKSVNELQNMGVQYIIIDEASFDAGYKAKFEKYNGRTVIQNLMKDNSVHLVKTFDKYAVFAINAKK